VQHRHPYTKGQSGGANNQHPHQAASAHDQNLPCAGPTFQVRNWGLTTKGGGLLP
jgi:hypothetical protein